MAVVSSPKHFRKRGPAHRNAARGGTRGNSPCALLSILWQSSLMLCYSSDTLNRVMLSAPILTDEQRAVIVAWAKHHSTEIRAVMVFGSRHTGERREKDKPDPTPDVDIAVSIEAPSPHDRQHCFSLLRDEWAQELSDLLAGLKVDLNCADPITRPFVPLYAWPYELLWSDQARWSEQDLWG